MKHRIKIVVILLFVFRPAFSQSPPEYSGLDAETARIAGQITAALGGSDALLEGGPFFLGGFSSTLGNYWKTQILTEITKFQGKLKVLAAPAQNSLLLSGEIIILGDTVRVYTRVIDKASSVVLNSWTSDIPKTPFVAGLITITTITGGNSSSNIPADAYETDSREQPVAVSLPSSIARTLTPDDQDWFLVTSPSTVLVQAETLGEIDTRMELFLKGSTRRLDYDDDSGEEENARINFTVEAGREYLIMVRGYSASDTGFYEFNLSTAVLADQEYEPNDVLEDAFLLLPGDREIRAAISSNNDIDWYAVTVEEEGSLRLETKGNLDMLLGLFDSGGALLVSDDDSGEDGNSRITWPVQPGTYYVRVRSYDRDTGSYTLLTGVIREAADAFENDNSRNRAKELPLETRQEHSFTDREDIDWVYFIVPVEDVYRIRCGSTDDSVDAYIILYDEQGDVIDEGDYNEGADSYLQATLRPGKYYIRIHCVDFGVRNIYYISVGL
ncbi:MAG: PPC domain-containing protein [Treponema sp.]|jgi:hypothetical protein|nr:PPC domain-containing protein [Treponema sp.]